VAPTEVEERVLEGESAEVCACRLAAAKAQGEGVVLAADTLVHIDNEILGKPVDAEEALAMLLRLSGRTHRVTTGVFLGRPGEAEPFCVSTEVVFRELGAAEIQRYVDSGEPMDKAGAYGIQGGAAGFVSRIQGSYTNVVGLPLAEVVTGLARWGIAPGKVVPE
jgi:septum formation protein